MLSGTCPGGLPNLIEVMFEIVFNVLFSSSFAPQKQTSNYYLDSNFRYLPHFDFRIFQFSLQNLTFPFVLFICWPKKSGGVVGEVENSTERKINFQKRLSKLWWMALRFQMFINQDFWFCLGRFVNVNSQTYEGFDLNIVAVVVAYVL